MLVSKNKKYLLKKIITSVSTLLVLGFFLVLNSCTNNAKKSNTSTEPDASKKEIQKTVYASEVIPFFDYWKLILGDGSNAGFANNFENKDFFYTANDGNSNWIVFKSPNGGDTHGTSNNTRTELAQVKNGIRKLQMIN